MNAFFQMKLHKEKCFSFKKEVICEIVQIFSFYDWISRGEIWVHCLLSMTHQNGGNKVLGQSPVNHKIFQVVRSRDKRQSNKNVSTLFFNTVLTWLFTQSLSTLYLSHLQQAPTQSPVPNDLTPTNYLYILHRLHLHFHLPFLQYYLE